MGTNEKLRVRLQELHLTHAELARLVNEEIRELTGSPGKVSERTVHNWTCGRTRWPHERIRIALTKVCGCPLSQIGFAPRATAPPAASEDDVHRRRFLAITTASAATALTTAAGPRPAGTRRTSVGSSDVDRLRGELDALVALDDYQGGHTALERAALDGAEQSLQLQKASSSERVRRMLFSVSADYTAAAAWSCIDGRDFERAQALLDHCLTLAGLAQDSTAQLRVWNSLAVLHRQLENHNLGLAAAQAAHQTGAVRRDPLLRSMAHARTALAQASLGDRKAARRSLGHAAEAFDQGRELVRPSWTDFYTSSRSELESLSAIVLDGTGSPELAEAASHRALSAIPGRFRRNRGLATAQLALAQLHQGEVEQACATAGGVFEIMKGTPVPARMKTLMGDYHRSLLTVAGGSAEAREWGDRMRTEWSRA